MNSPPTAMTDKKEPKEERADPNIRYRYIGFEVFPEQKKPFFASEEEKTRYLGHLEEKKRLEEREFSLLFVSSFNKFERLVVFLAALTLLASPALPWFFLPTPHGNEMLLGFQLLPAVAGHLGSVFAASPLAGAGGVLVLLQLVLAFVGGVLLLLALFKKSLDIANPYGRTKKLLGFHFIPVIGCLLIFGFSSTGFFIPDSSLSIFREGFNIFDLLECAGWGFWAVFVAHWLSAVKSADL
ncbi:MAG TPA: hypothetical protein VFR89_03715 [candidate division Zixibacteria bacterium]|nr:hypothetical protein [candidate division Zixibacteria bacterium]